MYVSRCGYLGFVLAGLFVAPFCGAADQSDAATTPGSNATATTALSTLQAEHAADATTFVIENELDGLIAKDGGGACASAAGIDALQCLRLMAGLKKIPNPHKVVLSSFMRHPELLNGRVSNERFVELLQFYAQHLSNHSLTVAVQSAPNSIHSNGNGIWSMTDGPKLAVEPSQLKVLSYTVTEIDGGRILGRHFVLLKDHSRNELEVVDPSRPLKDLRYVLEFKKDANGSGGQIFLLNPTGAPARPYIYELNTVFDISLSKDGTVSSTQLKQDLTVEFIKGEIDRVAKELRGTDDFLNPRVWRAKTANFGLPGLDLPVEHGGSGWPASKVLEIFKYAGSHNLNFRDNVGGAHVRPLLKSKNPEMLGIVKQVARGAAYMAIAITEPDVGSDVTAIKSTSRKVEGGYRLTGKKRFNARLNQATHVIIFTQGTTGKAGKISVFVTPIDAPGLRIETLSAHGLTGNSYGGLSFDDVFVPESHLLGDDGEGMRIFFDHFNYWRLMQSASALGTGENALQQMAERIKTRHAFGGPIGRFTHLQQPIGQYSTELRMAYALAREAADLIDRGNYREAQPLICGLKAEGVEMALSAVDAATRAFGGEGYSGLVDLGDRLRDLNGLRIADGTTDVMRMNVVRHTFGQEFWDMAIQAKE